MMFFRGRCLWVRTNKGRLWSYNPETQEWKNEQGLPPRKSGKFKMKLEDLPNEDQLAVLLFGLTDDPDDDLNEEPEA